MNLQEYNPFNSFRLGQEEAIKKLIRLFEDSILDNRKNITLELAAPPGYGKTLMAWVLSQYALDAYGIKVICASPQEQDLDNIFTKYTLNGCNQVFAMRGDCYFKCPLAKIFHTPLKACECPISIGIKRIYKYKGKMIEPYELPCLDDPYQCLYIAARKQLFDSNFVIMSIKDFLKDYELTTSKRLVIIDDSHYLESDLLDLSKVRIPQQFLPLSVEGLEEYGKCLRKESLNLLDKTENFELKINKLNEFLTLNRDIRETEQSLKRLNYVHKIIEGNHPYLIDSHGYFKALSAKPIYEMLFEHGLCGIVLMSGTPNSQLLADSYASVEVPNIIPIGRREIHYEPVANMNRNREPKDVEKMAQAISNLHNQHRKHTLVHCNSFSLANEINKYLCNLEGMIFVGRKDGNELKDWQEAKAGIFLSVKSTDGLDLYGDDYPLNIISKLPFPNLGDEFIKRRMKEDGGFSFNLQTALAIQQAAGRCSRGADDYSMTYILDSGFSMFYTCHNSLFPDWFKSALFYRGKNLAQASQSAKQYRAMKRERAR